jgi:hypothetical protein
MQSYIGAVLIDTEKFMYAKRQFKEIGEKIVLKGSRRSISRRVAPGKK